MATNGPVESMPARDFNNSTATARGGMYVVDVHASLSLRNATQRRIRGIAFAVYAPEVGGKGSISVPSLDVAPGEFADAAIWGIGRARREAKLLFQGGAGPDHPVHTGLPESAYLKALLFQLG